MDGKKTVIVIVSYNSCHLLQECIKSIRTSLPEGSYKTIVVDNASTDGVDKWLDEQSDIILIKNSVNRGFAPACNQAVRMTEGTEYKDYDIFLLNNDTRLAKDSLFYLQKRLYSEDDIGAVSSISNYAGNKQRIEISFDKVDDYLAYGEKNNVPMDDDCEERVRLSGFAMLIKRKAWNDVGGFDESFVPGYFEDDALSMELLKKGWRLFLVKNSFIYHAGSQSFVREGKDKLNGYISENWTRFKNKYGFDIMDHAYPNEIFAVSLPYGKNDTFRLLQIGCGLGADIKAIRSSFPNCEAVGVESQNELYEIAHNTERIFVSIEDIEKAYPKGYFDVLITEDGFKERISRKELELIVSMCRKDAMLLIKNRKYERFDYENIKLIIWDMDDTFWDGTISETEVSIPEVNIELIRLLTDHGVINSISSKNDIEPVKHKLEEAGIWDCFVFNDINWDEKGSQITNKLDVMGLRAENTLFIDDNPRNLEEALYNNPELMTAGPDIIPYLIGHFTKHEAKDRTHTRLEQYKLLERKTDAKKPGISKEQFLYDSDIKVTINRNCLEELDRIHELVMRTNQLNFTKNRDNKELLTRQITDDWNDCAYIKVRDRFGDYGIVGFYCYNKREKVMEHFLFSCRVLGMGIEQFIYNTLGNPAFEIKQSVASQLDKETPIPWIKESKDDEIVDDKLLNNRVRILLKGPCDMSAIGIYLSGANLTNEFNYYNDLGFVTTGQNHSAHIRESAELSEEEIAAITRSVPFIVRGDFMTKIFSGKYHVICYSLLQDICSGLYRNKETGTYISFSSRNYDLTDVRNKQRFIDHEIQCHEFDLTEEIIDDFAKKWEFIGNTPLDMLLDNLDYIYENVQGKPLMILLLGSEVDYEGFNEEFAGLAEIYKEINPVIKAFAEDRERIKVIDPTKYINSQDDFEDCINHFSRNVYYEIAGEISRYINDYL